MTVVRRLAEPLQYGDREAYLMRIAELLRGCELGDGVVSRAAQQAQREFRRPPELDGRGNNHGSKYR